MAAYTVVALSNPVEGQEEEFNRWYDEVHLRGVRKVEGVVSATRLLAAPENVRAPQWRYLTLYQVETDNIERVLAGMYEAAGGVDTHSSDAVDLKNAFAAVFQPI